MGGAPLLLALAAVTVDYGWQPDQKGGLEYIVQIPPGQLNQSSEFTSRIDPRVRGLVSRVVIRIGDGPLKRDYGDLAPNMAQDRALAATQLPGTTETQMRSPSESGDIIRGQSGTTGFAMPNQSGAAIDNSLRRGTEVAGSVAQGAADTLRDVTGNVMQQGSSFLNQAGDPLRSSAQSANQTLNGYREGLNRSTQELRNSGTGLLTGSSSQTRPSTNYSRSTATAQATAPLRDDRSWKGAQKSRPTPSTSYQSTVADNSTYGQLGNAQAQSNSRLFPSTFGAPQSTNTTQPQYGPNLPPSSYGQQPRNDQQLAPVTNLQNVSTQQPIAQQPIAQQPVVQQPRTNPTNYGLTANPVPNQTTAPYNVNQQQPPAYQNPTQPYGQGYTQQTYGQNPYGIPQTSPPANQGNMLTGYNGNGQAGIMNQLTPLQQQQLLRLASVNNNGLLNGLGPLAPATEEKEEDADDKATTLLLKDRERLTGEAFSLRKANEDWAKAHGSLESQHSELQRLNASLETRMKSSERFKSFLLFSIVANIYFFIHMAKLVRKYRDLLTSVRTSGAAPQAT